MSTQARQLVACVVVGLVVSVLAAAVRLPGGRRVDGRDIYATGTAAALLTGLAFLAGVL